MEVYFNAALHSSVRKTFVSVVVHVWASAQFVIIGDWLFDHLFRCLPFHTNISQF